MKVLITGASSGIGRDMARILQQQNYEIIAVARDEEKLKELQQELGKEVKMIHTNIQAVHILTKLYLKDMVEKDQGKILNVASIAGFMPGPLMATYYATKAYVVRLSEAIKEELNKKN